MNIREYAEKVREEVEKRTGKEVTVEKVTKANAELTAVCIRDGNVGMNFYVDTDYENDEPIWSCADKAIEMYDANPYPPFDVENYDFEFDAIKDKLIPRVLDMQRNRSFLADAVYKDVGCGLALVADIVEGDYRITVRKGLAQSNHYDEEKVISTSLKNEEQGIRLSSMMSAIFGGNENILNTDSKADEGMYVLTNKDAFFGASAMFCDGVLDKVRDRLGCGYFVLPSSIHEVIIVPDSAYKEAEELKKIVVEANRSVVEPKDILSDKVFHFDGKLEVVA